MNIPENSHIWVVAGAVQGEPFTLPQVLVLPDGSKVSNPASLPLADKLAIGLYPVVETVPPSFDERYQTATPVYTVLSDHVSLNYSVATMPLADYKAKRIKELYRIAKEKIDALTADYSPGEMADWARLEDECRAYQADTTGSPPIGPAMQAEVSMGRDPAELAATVIAKSYALRAAKAAISAARTRHKSAIMALTDHASVAGYDLTAGW